MNSDFSDLLSAFNEHQVRYLVVGGYAVIKYAEPRYTKDIDLWISADAGNAAAVFTALREYGAPLSGLSEADFTQKGFGYQLGVAPVRIDILMSISGVEFDDAWSRREVADFAGIQVPFISKQDLIQSKKAAGRQQDLIDAQLLSESEEP